MISVQCACGKAFMTKPANAGKKTKCPTCGKMLTIPGGVSAAADEIDKLLDSWPTVSSPPPPPTPASASVLPQAPSPASTTSNSAPQQAVSLSSAIHGEPPTSAVTQTLSRTQGTMIICLLVAALGIPGLSWLMPLPKWEYRTLEVLAVRPETDLADSIRLSEFMRKTVPDATSQLGALGQEGWELTAVFLEDETVHPNFGKDSLVTGLQPNTRPQKLVCLLKRRKRF